MNFHFKPYSANNNNKSFQNNKKIHLFWAHFGPQTCTPEFCLIWKWAKEETNYIKPNIIKLNIQVLNEN